MKIRQAPIVDLLKYLEESCDNRIKFYKASSILNVADVYYCSLSNRKTIIPIGNDFMTDWCDLNYSETIENCPNIPGIIVYKIKPDGTKFYGILYRSGYFTTANQQTDFLSYYYINSEGYISSLGFCIEEWDGWGAPVRYFNFSPDDYSDNNLWQLGERPLTFHDLGHDVKQLQAFLHRAHPIVSIHGHFDNETLKALHETQFWCNVPKSDIFQVDDAGRKILEFLINGH